MKTKLTALIVACSAVAAGAVAHAAPIPVAVYTFQSMDDVNAFQKVFGAKCNRKWAGNQALGITVARSTNSCQFRSSVVGDSSSGQSDQGMVATVTVNAGSNKKLQKKAFVGVGVRRSDTAGYFLRILPNTHKWQYVRDPKGSAGAKIEAAGSGAFIKLGGKPNVIAIRAFSRGGSTTSVVASVNGTTVVNTTDSGDQPDGRQTVVMTGAKGSGAGTGITGVFDNVTVQVPNPF